MDLSFSADALIAAVALFFGVGIFMTIRTLLDLHRKRIQGGPLQSFKEQIRANIGPVQREKAPLNAPLRVFVEFIGALGGVPGLGWSLSARLAPGIALLLAGPIFCWMAYPMILYYTGHMSTDPFLLIKELPLIACASAATLAVLEARTARSHGGHEAS